jgi:predicted DNA-binding transcriptional regulator AlpA
MTVAERYQHLNTRQVMKYIGTESPSTVWLYVKAGKLPKPRYPSPHRPVWRLGEVVDQFTRHLQEYDEAPRAYREDPELDQPRPQVQKKGSSAAARLRERLGLTGRK